VQGSARPLHEKDKSNELRLLGTDAWKEPIAMDPASATIVAASITGIATVAGPWLKGRARRQACPEEHPDDAGIQLDSQAMAQDPRPDDIS